MLKPGEISAEYSICIGENKRVICKSNTGCCLFTYKLVGPDELKYPCKHKCYSTLTSAEIAKLS